MANQTIRVTNSRGRSYCIPKPVSVELKPASSHDGKTVVVWWALADNRKHWYPYDVSAFNSMHDVRWTPLTPTSGVANERAKIIRKIRSMLNKPIGRSGDQCLIELLAWIRKRGANEKAVSPPQPPSYVSFVSEGKVVHVNI